MDLARETVNNVGVWCVGGRLDSAEADAFRSGLARIVAEDAGPVVLDMTGVAFIGSAALGALVTFRKELGEGRKLALCGLSVPIHKMFKVAAFDKIFQITASQAEAVSLVAGA